MVSQWLIGPQRDLTRFYEIARYKEGLYRLGSQTYAWLVPNGSWGETNLGIITCEGKSVLIDTCWDVKFTEEFLQTVKHLLKASPVELVINTHCDGDHYWGNQLFKDCRIIATSAAIDQIDSTLPHVLQQLKQGTKWLQKLPFRSLHRFGSYMYNMLQPYDFSSIIHTPPNYPFSGEHVVMLNGMEIVIREVGPGHSAGDAIVYVPDQKVVYAGDLLFVGSTPVMRRGPLENLMLGLKQLLTLDVEFIVPGHGPLARKEDVQHLMDYWEYIHEALHQRFIRQMSPWEAAADILCSSAFKATPYAKWDSPERLVTNADTLYRHWGARSSILPGLLGQLDLFRRQARTVLVLPYATPRRLRGIKGEGIELYLKS